MLALCLMIPEQTVTFVFELMAQDRRGDIGLDAYMRLPVEHYFELDPGLIKPLGGNAFALKVPRVSVSF